MAYDVQEGSFPFHRPKKPFSIFLGAKNGVFCEAATKLKFHIGTKPFLKNTRPP
jgi:hypothetical protein